MLTGLKILLVEDQVMIAMDVEMMLYDGGAASVQTAASTKEALEKIAAGPPDAAILDINLGTDTSFSVAEKLLALGIPFIFATGYGDSSLLPDAMTGVRIVQKPYQAAALADALDGAMRAKRT